jgi:hypothetical protein
VSEFQPGDLVQVTSADGTVVKALITLDEHGPGIQLEHASEPLSGMSVEQFEAATGARVERLP